MANILIVSDNEILNQLYAANLEVYLDAKVTIVKSLKEATDLLKYNTIKIIITEHEINGEKISKSLDEYITREQKKIKMFVFGKNKETAINAVVINSPYDLKFIVKNSATALGITAKEMVEKEMPVYYPMACDFLLKIHEVPCNLYIKMKEEQFTLIAQKGDSLNLIMSDLKEQGVDVLYVHSNNRLVLINAISSSLVLVLQNTQGVEVNVKNEMVKNGFNLVVNSFSQNKEVTEEVAQLAAKCSKVLDEIVKEVPTIKKLLDLLNNSKDGYVYTHSVLCAYISNHIIRNVSWGGESQIEKINFVIFFHDIILAPIYLRYPHLKYEEDLLFSDELSDKDKEIVLSHAKLAAELVVSIKRAPIGVDLLIKQHHGMTNGVGFALDFKDDISPLSKVILVAETFVEEFLKKLDENPSYKLNMGEIMSLLYSKFHRPTYKKIIETLNDIKI